MPPLVSIGIPTYNRPTELRRALQSATNQTYKNLEIVVSDNCSPNDPTRDIIKEFNDPRIVYYHQRRNLGRDANITFVLSKATGDYFMWLSDDDWIEPYFVQLCLYGFREDDVAVGMEAQYFDDSNQFRFFREGENLYEGSNDLSYILEHNYGNMFYSLFRATAVKGYVAKGDNEIPLFLHVAQKGNWRILPTAGLHKKTNEATYQQARWETLGGWKQRGNLISDTLYTARAFKDISVAISNLNTGSKLKLQYLNVVLTAKHFCYLVIGWKA